MTFLKKTCSLFTISLLLGLTVSSAQSPQKLLDHGYYEQAYLDAVKKQNKKTKLKPKYADVIKEAYELIYKKHSDNIMNKQTTWTQGYNNLYRNMEFRSRCKHPVLYDGLKNILYDEVILDQLGDKFNHYNKKDLEKAREFETDGKFEKAIDLYKVIKKRHDQAVPITTFADRLDIVDTEELIENANIKIGDQYIKEAEELLHSKKEKAAQNALTLINKAKRHRPLSIEEEELITLANLIMGNASIEEAKELLEARTKKNARLAFELISRAQNLRSLNAEEAQMMETAQKLGMTRIMVKSNNKIHDAQKLAGILNASKNSRWIDYFYTSPGGGMAVDFELEATEGTPTAVVGKVQKSIKQETKTVEYYEDVTDANGNTTSEKRTRQVVGIVATLSQTKTAKVKWSFTVTDAVNNNSIHSQSSETIIEEHHKYASMESGDAEVLPENVETEVGLDSQPFSSNEEMIPAVTAKYVSEMRFAVNAGQIHMQNIDAVIPE